MLYLRKTQELALRNLAARFLAGTRSYSRDYDSSDDEKDKKSKTKKEKPVKAKSNPEAAAEESASSKLNRLLASMQTEDHLNLSKKVDVVPKPGEANKKKKLQVKQNAESKDIFTAAKRVASMLGEENKQQTESELLAKLLGGKSPAGASGGETSQTDGASPEAEISLSDLIVGMKIDRRQSQKDSPPTRSEYVRRSIAAKGNQRQQYRKDSSSSNERRPTQRRREAATYTGSVNLFGGEPLGIFTEPSQLQDSTDFLPTWSYLQEQSLKLQVSHPPSNYFDKLALWTEQGKVWRFPIDNEQDWLNEQNVDFSEHIFLEQHLEGWCPNRGPIRHFMELVCVGLSKNPFITAKEKKDHILWYRDYFETKKDILKDLMAEEAKSKDKKQVEA